MIAYNSGLKKLTIKNMSKKQLINSHPEQHLVNVVMTNGDKFQIYTSWGKEGQTLTLDMDPKNHPAWQEKGQNYVNANSERVNNFTKKFGDFKL